MESVQGKNVVITGGSSGIGLATAALLVDRGCNVLITGRSSASLTAAQRALGGRCSSFRGDISRTEDRVGLVETIRERFGSIDLLFANDGITRFVPFAEMTEAEFDAPSRASSQRAGYG